MRLRLLTGLCAGSLALAVPVPAAVAHPGHHYHGGCSFRAVDDAVLSGPNQWRGIAALRVVAADASGVPTPADPITASCDLYKNGVLVATVLGPVTGTGVAASASAPFSFTAAATDVVRVCADVTVAGEAHYECFPPPLTCLGCWPGPDEIVTALNRMVFETYVDPTLCAVLAELAPAVNALDQPGVIRIDEDPAGGADVWLLDAEFWLCPDYYTR